LSKEILILNGSPRIKGNTAVLSDRLASGAKESGAETEIIYLHGLDIQPCDACDSCQITGKGCIIGDDMEEIYPKLRSSDTIVIATPVYWFSMTSQMKLCMDRWYALGSSEDYELKGKRLALLMVYGDTDLYSSGGITVIRTLEASCQYVGMDFYGIVHGSALDIGDAEKNPALMDQAYQLGKQLAESA
jgi:multimeric flavodoxin WrbA